jgi:WD40 repeat protein
MTVRVWDAETGKQLGEPLRGHGKWVASVSFSSDGTRVASGSGDNTICVWYSKTGQQLGEPLRGHTNCIESVSFSLDGALIVSGAGDKTIRVWDATIVQDVSNPLSIQPHHANEDGWVLGPHNELLFWVPKRLRRGFFWPGTIAIMGRVKTTKVDFTDVAHGERWTECFAPSP